MSFESRTFKYTCDLNRLTGWKYILDCPALVIKYLHVNTIIWYLLLLVYTLAKRAYITAMEIKQLTLMIVSLCLINLFEYKSLCSKSGWTQENNIPIVITPAVIYTYITFHPKVHATLCNKQQTNSKLHDTSLYIERDLIYYIINSIHINFIVFDMKCSPSFTFLHRVVTLYSIYQTHKYVHNIEMINICNLESKILCLENVEKDYFLKRKVNTHAQIPIVYYVRNK